LQFGQATCGPGKFPASNQIKKKVKQAKCENILMNEEQSGTSKK